jgi:hypothetical protein
MFRAVMGKILYRRGMANAKMGDATAAIADFREANVLHPDDKVWPRERERERVCVCVID